ncbi:MAG: deoxyribose-phosphate aldolase [Oscillospiraceae bacterium]|nr:deoxyribose-phosphate aldolase [Oscillospiraceae bacterium]
MDIKDILKTVDHTLLTQTATSEEILTLCDDGIKYGVASVCIPPCYVNLAKKHVQDKLKVCTVIGFPNGYSTTETKIYETIDAISDGADEIDMVINLGKVKDKKYDEVKDEISKIKEVCQGRILKVIIETCLLTEDEKIEMCHVVEESGADFIKTSTGFSTKGATFDDVKLFKENLREGFGIKAAGGIQSLDDAIKFLELGATRLGTSRIVKLAKNEVGITA